MVGATSASSSKRQLNGKSPPCRPYRRMSASKESPFADNGISFPSMKTATLIRRAGWTGWERIPESRDHRRDSFLPENGRLRKLISRLTQTAEKLRMPVLPEAVSDKKGRACALTGSALLYGLPDSLFLPCVLFRRGIKTTG